MRAREIGTWGQGVTVPQSHQAVRVNWAKSNSWPTHSSQRATHTFLLSFPAVREGHCFLQNFHMQTCISCNCLSNMRCGGVLLCVCVAAAQGPFLKAPRFHYLPVILCDRCIPPGRVEFELFIKAHESIKSHGAVGHKHSYPYVESCQERSQCQY